MRRCPTNTRPVGTVLNNRIVDLTYVLIYGMHVEREWHARVAQFQDPIDRFQPPATVDLPLRRLASVKTTETGMKKDPCLAR